MKTFIQRELKIQSYRVMAKFPLELNGGIYLKLSVNNGFQRIISGWRRRFWIASLKLQNTKETIAADAIVVEQIQLGTQRM